MRRFSACKDCTNREIGCHSKCEIYAEEKMQYEAEKNVIYEKKRRENDIENFTLMSQERRHGKDRGRIK